MNRSAMNKPANPVGTAVFAAEYEPLTMSASLGHPADDFVKEWQDLIGRAAKLSKAKPAPVAVKKWAPDRVKSLLARFGQ